MSMEASTNNENKVFVGGAARPDQNPAAASPQPDKAHDMSLILRRLCPSTRLTGCPPGSAEDDLRKVCASSDPCSPAIPPPLLAIAATPEHQR